MLNNEQNYSRVIPVWKFALFSVASLGIYEVYWSYKSWKFFKEKDDLNISPFWRAFFMGIFIWPLFNRYSGMLKKEGYEVGYPIPLLVLIWFGIVLIGNIAEDPIWLISFLSFLVFVPILNITNAYWKAKSPGLPEKPLTWWQIILLISGIIFVLALVGYTLT